MIASRRLVESLPVIQNRGLRLLSGSGTHMARKSVANRDGRIRLVREAAPAVSTDEQEVAARRAHERLRLPSLERWLSSHVW